MRAGVEGQAGWCLPVFGESGEEKRSASVIQRCQSLISALPSVQVVLREGRYHGDPDPHSQPLYRFLEQQIWAELWDNPVLVLTSLLSGGATFAGPAPPTTVSNAGTTSWEPGGVRYGGPGSGRHVCSTESGHLTQKIAKAKNPKLKKNPNPRG